VEADVHMAIKDGYRLKVSIHGVGMYINGWQMYHSKRHSSGWKSTAPSYTVKGKLYHPLEFNKKEQLWKDIDIACLRAIAREEKNNGNHENPFRKISRPEM
jgi:hypothetical protein